MYNNKKKEVDLKIVSGKNNNPFTQKEDDGIEKLKNEHAELSKKLMSDEVSFEDKMKLLLQMNSKTFPSLIDELKAMEPNVDRSTVAYQILKFHKEMREIVIKKREVEISDEINPYAPKFQFAFESFAELFHAVMISQGIDEIEINNFFMALAGEIAGWEEVLIKAVKGISSKTVSKLHNPFLEKFKDQIKYVKECKEAERNMYFI
jgi:hypothetical protein